MSRPQVGETLPELEVRLTRAEVARYAAASGDDNPVHRDDPAARAAGLPGVVAHGMHTMGLAARLVGEWVGDPARDQPYRLTSLRVRFTRPVLVPDDGRGAVLTLGGTVAAVAEDGEVRVDLRAHTVAGGADPVSVLGQAQATVRPA